ncbi:MAG: DUF2723 domain-containing protein [Candidatus Riflebacteria bacterium]|nr:DUF2723 domain-containing protein [Candidatus Riflebacteria bacterium]
MDHIRETSNQLGLLGRNSILFCFLTFLVALFIFIPTLKYGVGWYNTGEFTVAALTLDVPHSPGYPLFTRLGNLFLKIPLNFEPAYKMNLFTAIISSFGVSAFFLFLRMGGISNFFAFFASVWLCSFKTFWEKSIGAEGYSLEILLICSFLCISWQILFNNKKSGFFFFLTGLSYTLGIGHRPTFFLQTFGIILLWPFYQHLKDYKNKSGWIILGLVVGFLPSVDLYFRLQNPDRVLTDPMLGAGLAGFWNAFSAREFSKGLGVFSLPELFTRFKEWILLLGTDGRFTCLLLPLFLLNQKKPLNPQISAFFWLLFVNSTFYLNYNAFEVGKMLLPSMCALTGLSVHALHYMRNKSTIRISFSIMVILSILISSQYLEPRVSESEIWARRIFQLLPNKATVLLDNDVEFRPIWYLRLCKALRPDINLRLVDNISESDIPTLAVEAKKNGLFGTLVYPYDLREKLEKFFYLRPFGYLTKIESSQEIANESNFSNWKFLKVLENSRIYLPPSIAFFHMPGKEGPITQGGHLKNGDALFFEYAISNPSSDYFIFSLISDKNGKLFNSNGILTGFDLCPLSNEKNSLGNCRIFKRSLVIPEDTPEGNYQLKVLLGRKESLFKSKLICENLDNLPYLNANGATEVFLLKNAMAGKPFIKAKCINDLLIKDLWINQDNPINLSDLKITR